MTILQPNPPWHHTILDQKMIDRILEAIPKVYIQEQIAHYCGIYPQRLSDWLKFGKRDIEADIKNSIYADFYQQYHEKRSAVIGRKLRKLGKCPKNYGAVTWVLEHCFKEEFMKYPEEVQKILDFVLNDLPKMMDKGEFPNGGKESKEMDTICD